MTLGERIHKFRTEKGLSQGDLAEVLDVSRQSISKWETDGSVPELDKLVKLGEIFEVTLDELVTGNGKPEAEPAPTPAAVQAEPKIIYVEKPVMPNISAAQILGIILILGSLLCFVVFDDLRDALFLCLPVAIWGVLCLVTKQPLLWSCWCGSLAWWVYVFVLSARWEAATLFLLLGILLVVFSTWYTVYLHKKHRIHVPIWGWAVLVILLTAAALLLAVNLLPPIEGSVTRPSEITVAPDGSVGIE